MLPAIPEQKKKKNEQAQLWHLARSAVSCSKQTIHVAQTSATGSIQINARRARPLRTQQALVLGPFMAQTRQRIWCHSVAAVISPPIRPQAQLAARSRLPAPSERMLPSSLLSFRGQGCVNHGRCATDARRHGNQAATGVFPGLDRHRARAESPMWAEPRP